MAITPKGSFDFALRRSRHQLALYDILHDSRQRGIRSDWRKAFCELMHWPKNEAIVRIDGSEKNSILVLREAVGLSREEFAHEYVSEVLRGAIVSTVSAMDRYIHDQVTVNSLGLLRRSEAKIPSGLKNVRVPLLTVKKSLEKLRGDSAARPGAILKSDLRDVLHRDETFQSVSGVEKGAKMLGIPDFWKELTKKMTGYSKPGDVQDELRVISTRRNQIVHEADLIIQDRGREPKLRDIDRREVEVSIDFIENLIDSFDELVEKCC